MPSVRGASMTRQGVPVGDRNSPVAVIVARLRWFVARSSVLPVGVADAFADQHAEQSCPSVKLCRQPPVATTAVRPCISLGVEGRDREGP